MEAKVLKVNDGEGQVLLTYKRLAAEKGNKRLEEAFENQEVLNSKSSTGISRWIKRSSRRSKSIYPCKPCIRYIRERSI